MKSSLDCYSCIQTRRIPRMNSAFSGAALQTIPVTHLRHDWKKEEVAAIYATPLPELVYRAQTKHREFHAPDRVQTCQLISIKTGGCPEDCAYCPQSAHYDADVEREGLLDPQHVISVAREAAARGVTRFCMGDRKSTRLNSSHPSLSRMPSSA